MKARENAMRIKRHEVDEMNRKVEDLEEHDMPVADFTLEDMKKQRVRLKDELYHLLLAFRAGQKSVSA